MRGGPRWDPGLHPAVIPPLPNRGTHWRSHVQKKRSKNVRVDSVKAATADKLPLGYCAMSELWLMQLNPFSKNSVKRVLQPRVVANRSTSLHAHAMVPNMQKVHVTEQERGKHFDTATAITNVLKQSRRRARCHVKGMQANDIRASMLTRHVDSHCPPRHQIVASGVVELSSKATRQGNYESTSIGVRAEGAIVVMRRSTLSQVAKIVPRAMSLLNACDIMRHD